MNDRAARTIIVVPITMGSMEQLRELLSSLPPHLSAPVVVPVRGPADAPASVGQKLAGVASREVVVLTSGSAPLADAGIVVIPSGRSVETGEGEISVQDTTENAESGLSPAVGALARALAERVVGVIIDAEATGAPNDIYEIHGQGGTVIVEGLLGLDGLPNTVPPSHVDVVAPLGEMGAVVAGLLGNGQLPSERSTSETLRRLLDDLRNRFGINFSAYKQPTIIRRIQRRMADTGQTTLGAYHDYLESHPEEYQRLVSSFLIKVTSFFRDPELYDYLQRHIIPNLLDYAQSHDGELRVWSAGCATGEEAYSLAILLSEALNGRTDSVRVRIFATDLDAGAIEFARRGVYPEAALDDLPQELVGRYFVRIDGEYQVAKTIRAMCIFGQHDLAERAPFPRIDLLVSRNVLIYFTAELQRRVLQLFAFSLRDNGYLVLGKSETTTPLPEHFTADNARLKVYRRRGERMLIPPARIHEAMTPDLPTRHQPRRPQTLEAVRSAQEGNPQPRLRERADGALMYLPIGVILVNSQYDIQLINHAARRLLHIHGDALGEDLVHLAQDLPVREFRRAIDQAFRDGQSTDIPGIPVTDPSTGQQQYLRVTVAPIQDSRVETIVHVLVEDMTEVLLQQQTLEQSLDSERREIASLRDQVERLSETNGELLAANQELTVANAELRATNEEYLVGNEELQAAAEEVETLNEELQATVEELNATNEDLQSRSVELEDLAVSLQTQRAEIDMERARLEAILSSMADAVVMVDPAGRIALTNAAFRAMFPGPFQPVDAHGQPIPDEATPWAAAARGDPCEMEFMVQDPDGTQRWFEATGRPIDGGPGAQGGAAVIRDITDRSIHRLQEEFMSVASHELRGPLTVLNGYLTMLQRSLSGEIDAERLRSYLDQARHQTERLQILVRDLVDVTRLQQGKISLQLGPVDAAEVAKQAVAAARQIAPGSPIEAQLPEEPVTVRGDATRLEQVLLNLLTNAATYAGDSGPIELSLTARDGEAAMTISDRGPGIPPEDLPHLFGRFYTGANQGREGGLGLGLYISRELVDAMDGSISVESEIGKGSAFTVTLPLADV